MYHKSFRIAAIAMYNYFHSCRKVATILNVCAASVWRWCKCLESKKRSYSTYSSKVTTAMLHFAKVMFNDNAACTQTQLRCKMSQSFGAPISRYLVRTIIRLLGYSYKRVRLRGQTYCNGTQRHAFITAMSQVNSCTIVSVDESGFDHRMKPLYGYAQKGTPAIIKYKTSKDRLHYSLLMAVDNNGAQTHELATGKVNGIRFANFINRLTYPPGTVLIMDNATIHKTADVKSVVEQKGYKIQFIAPYCCEDNPIEMVFSGVKRQYYQSRAKSSWSDNIPLQIDLAINLRVTPNCIINCFKCVQKLWHDHMHAIRT